MHRVQLSGCLGHQRSIVEQCLVKLGPALCTHLGVVVASYCGKDNTGSVGEVGVSVPAHHLFVVEFLFGRIELLLQLYEASDDKWLLFKHRVGGRERPLLVFIFESELLCKKVLHFFSYFVAVALLEP